MKELLYKMFGHKSLSKEEAKQVLLNISDGRYNDSQLSAFMTVFLMRSITTEELAGFREAILERRVVVDLDCHDAIDIVGTGGDGKNTFNISTAACFVVAGANEKLPLAETPPPAAKLSTDTETFTAFCAGGASVDGCELEPLAVEPDTGALPAAGADAVAPLSPNGESVGSVVAAWPAPSLVCEGASACAWLVPPSGESAACELASNAASGKPVLPAVG